MRVMNTVHLSIWINISHWHSTHPTLDLGTFVFHRSNESNEHINICVSYYSPNSGVLVYRRSCVIQWWSVSHSSVVAFLVCVSILYDTHIRTKSLNNEYQNAAVTEGHMTGHLYYLGAK